MSSRSIFIEVELMKGKSLSDHLLAHRRHDNLPEFLVRDMLHQLSKRPDYLHKSYSGQIVHSNLIPEDIFYDNGAMLIASYGLLLPTNTFIHNSAAVIKVLPVRNAQVRQQHQIEYAAVWAVEPYPLDDRS